MGTEVWVEFRSAGNCPETKTLHQTSFLIPSSHSASNPISSKSHVLRGFLSPPSPFYSLPSYLFSFTPNAPHHRVPLAPQPVSTHLRSATSPLYLVFPPFPPNPSLRALVFSSSPPSSSPRCSYFYFPEVLPLSLFSLFFLRLFFLTHRHFLWLAVSIDPPVFSHFWGRRESLKGKSF